MGGRGEEIQESCGQELSDGFRLVKLCFPATPLQYLREFKVLPRSWLLLHPYHSSQAF